VYFINNRKLIKIPSEYRLTGPLFWNHYIIFYGAESDYYFIYSIETGILSGYIEPGPKGLGVLIPVDKGPNLFFNFDGWEYEFDPVSLELINRRDVPLEIFSYKWYDLHWRETSMKYLGGRFIRYQEEDSEYYLDVRFGPNIEISLRGEWNIQGMGKQFVLVVKDYYLGK
jgi:hypothetical protein